MIHYDALEYLVAFADGGTLSQVAEQFHISQPTITRAMQHIEEKFGVSLFERTKNSIQLKDSGRLAAEEAAAVIKQTQEMIRRVRVYDRAKHTIFIGSSAAVQIPGLIGRMSAVYPNMTISTELKKPATLLAGLEADSYQLIILPYQPEAIEFLSTAIGEEHLMFFLPKGHRFAKRKSLTLGEMNGENMLLFSEIGFWHDLVTDKMPDSRFLVQNERYSMEELVLNSVLPCFITDLSSANRQRPENRTCVPITDAEVQVTYWLVCKKENRKRFSTLFP